MHKRSLGQFWLEIRILTTLTENFQAKIGFILLQFTDRLPMVKYCNLPITGGTTPCITRASIVTNTK